MRGMQAGLAVSVKIRDGCERESDGVDRCEVGHVFAFRGGCVQGAIFNARIAFSLRIRS
jgi:hypothetical protein